MLTLLLAAAITAFDLRLKDGIEAQSEDVFPQELAVGHLVLKRHHNCGILLGSFQKHPEEMTSLSASMIGLVFLRLLSLMRRRKNSGEQLALSLILGGAVSNLADRLRFGYVVDYFSFKAGKKLPNIIFNFGDLAVFAGCLIFFLRSLLSKEEPVDIRNHPTDV